MSLFAHLHLSYQQDPFQHFRGLDETLFQILENLTLLATQFEAKKLLFRFDSMIQMVRTYDVFS